SSSPLSLLSLRSLLPSPVLARFFLSPLSLVRLSKIYPPPASKTACPPLALAAVCNCLLPPSTRLPLSLLLLLRLVPAMPTLLSPVCHLQEIDNLTATLSPLTPPGPITQDHPPHPLCS